DCIHPFYLRRQARRYCLVIPGKPVAMFEPLFSFIEPIVDPVIEMGEDGAYFAILAETSFDCVEKPGHNKVTKLPERAKIEVPIDIALSLLKPEELEKLQKYLAFYLAKHPNCER